MITAIVAKLKEGKVKNVVALGQATKLPAPPYIVVREENDPLGRGDIYRVIIHGPIGTIVLLKEYMAEVQSLLNDFEGTTHLGNKQRICAEGPVRGIIEGNDDGTIAIERTYLCPTIYF